jgi:hypothetical protein
MTHSHFGIDRLGRVAFAVVIASLAACGPLRRVPASERALIYFTNESLDQADVYGIVPGSRAVRIGTVFAGRTDTLVVPTELLRLGNVNVVARLLAKSNTPSSGPVSINAGDRLQVRLPVDQKLLVVLPADR